MDGYPEPFTPADCDLRDFQYMPLDVQRLCDSDLAALESPEACWAALLLWSKSWHQVPSGSLPDDDRILAKFTGYQRAPEAWAAIRDGALRGWVKCSDGRLYHQVVAEKANEAWLAKHRMAHEKLADRIRKRNKARAESGLPALDIPDLERWIDAGRPLEKVLFPTEFSSPSGGIPAEEDRKEHGIPSENALKGEERKGKEIEKETKSKTKPAREPRFDAQAHLESMGVDRQVVQDWLTHRRAKRAAVTETVIAQHLSEARKGGMSLQDALRESCSRGWTGFKAEWMANRGNAQAPPSRGARDESRAAAAASIGLGARNYGIERNEFIDAECQVID